MPADAGQIGDPQQLAQGNKGPVLHHKFREGLWVAPMDSADAGKREVARDSSAAHPHTF